MKYLKSYKSINESTFFDNTETILDLLLPIKDNGFMLYFYPDILRIDKDHRSFNINEIISDLEFPLSYMEKEMKLKLNKISGVYGHSSVNSKLTANLFEKFNIHNTNDIIKSLETPELFYIHFWINDI